MSDRMILPTGFNLSDKIDGGAFADIFLHEASGQVYKLFKGPCHPDLKGTGELQIGLLHWVEFRMKVFNSEVEAHRLLQGNPEYLEYAPEYGGTHNIHSVWSHDDDISSHYMLDCCYSMSYVRGKKIEVKPVLRNPDKVKRIMGLTGVDLRRVISGFKKIGIMHTDDCDAIISEGELKLVDFAVEDVKPFS